MKTLILALAVSAGFACAQSLLTDPPETATDMAARETLVVLQVAKASILGIVRDGVARTFGTSDRQAVMDKLGTRAGKAVTYYETLISATQAILTEDGDTAGLAELASIISGVPAYSKNEDGTVTILPTPEPTPTPEP